MKQLPHHSPPRRGGLAPRSASPGGRSLKESVVRPDEMSRRSSIEASPSRARASRHPIRAASLPVDGASSPAPRAGESSALQHALRQYEELYDLAPLCLLTLDRRGIMLTLNERAARLVALPIQWLRGRPFLVFVAGHDVGRFLELLSRLRHAPGVRQMLEIELCVNDRFVPVQVWMGSSRRVNEIIYHMAIVDLSEVRAIEKELKEALNNWYSLVQSAPDIIMTVDHNSHITFANRHVWGYSARALAGTRLTDYVSEKYRAKLKKCVGTAFTGQPTAFECCGVNGDKRWYSFSFGPVHHDSQTAKEAKTTTVTIRDISEHKRIEQSLRKSREQLREFAGRLDQAREEERTRVAREIHDQLGQALTILKMDLSWLKAQTHSGDGAPKKIKSMIAHVDQTIETVRKIVTELRPSILDEIGLPAAIEWQLSQFQERTGIRGIFESSHGSDTFELSCDVGAALFRVVQEALTNIVRHAGATEVRIGMKSLGNVLTISITDNGRGITRQQINDPRSFGIVGMKERVHRIGGQFNIYSSPGRGTRIEISTPPND